MPPSPPPTPTPLNETLQVYAYYSIASSAYECLLYYVTAYFCLESIFCGLDIYRNNGENMFYHEDLPGNGSCSLGTDLKYWSNAISHCKLVNYAAWLIALRGSDEKHEDEYAG